MNGEQQTEEQIKADAWVNKFKVQYDIGVAILNQLFPLNKEEMKAKVDSICGDMLPDYFIKNCHVIKTSEDDQPEKIELVSYDRVTITWSGIEFKPEHGKVRDLVKFNEHFKL